MTVKFLFIVFCFVFALCTYKFAYCKRDWAWLVGGLGFTVGADFFLVLHNQHLFGVAVFCFAHACYIIHGMKIRRTNTTLFFCILSAVVFLFVMNNFLFGLAAVYACLFAVNIFVHVVKLKKSRKHRLNHKLMLAGLLLFLLCDMNVLLFNLPLHTGIYFPPQVMRIIFISIWVFYLPAISVISASSIALFSSSSSISAVTSSSLDTETS